MHDNSCSCEVFILSWTQLKAERPRRHVDLSSLSQSKVSIPGQKRHINYGPAKPEVIEVFNSKCPSHKSIQTFILGLRTDSIVVEHVASLLVSSTLLSRPCEPGVVSKVFGTFRHSKINQSDSLTSSPVPGKSSEARSENRGSETTLGTRLTLGHLRETDRTPNLTIWWMGWRSISQEQSAKCFENSVKVKQQFINFMHVKQKQNVYGYIFKEDLQT